MAHANWDMRGQFNKGNVKKELFIEGGKRLGNHIWEGSLCSTLGAYKRKWYIPRPEGEKEGVMLKPGGRCYRKEL